MMKRRIVLFAMFVAAAMSSFTAGAQAVVTLDLARPDVPAAFEMASNRIWRHTYDNGFPEIRFNGGTFSFTHLVDGDGFGNENEWGYWDGFTYSMDGDNTDYGAGDSDSWVAHQFGNMAGGGIRTDDDGNVMRDPGGRVLTDPGIPYLVGYWGYYKLLFGASDRQTLQVNLDRVYRAVGVYVNNHPWPYYGNVNGDSFSRPFEREGDHFSLVIHGLDGSLHESGTAVRHDFARFQGGTIRQSPDWEWVDLSALGDVGGIYFTMESSDNDPIVGMNTAAYFCLDRLAVADVPQNVAVTGVALDRTSASLTAGASLQLAATVLPAGATNRAVTWTGSNAAVATVSATGLVTGLSAGQATVTVRTAEGGFTASCAVTVTDAAPGTIAVTGVALDRTSASLTAGASLQLAATVSPAGATNKAVTWTGSNAAVATVSATGLVRAVSAGQATVTVRTAEGGFTASCAVTVTDAAPGTVAVEGVALDRTSATLRPGDMLQLAATVLPAGATNKAVTWTGSNEAAAIVTVNGLVVAFADGEAIIVARTADGGFTASCRVTVDSRTATDPVPEAARTAVYPNPFAAFVIVETPADCRAIILDLHGRTVLQAVLHAGVNRLDTSRLPAGIYFLKYGRRTVKLISFN